MLLTCSLSGMPIKTFNSGKLVGADDLLVNNPGFRAIYIMSYPESIQRVG
jgi:hypothetical protein